MKKLSQSDISAATGIHKATISKYLRGVIVPSVAVAKFVERRTGLPVEVFVSLDVQEAYLDQTYLDEEVMYIPKKRRK